MPDYRNYGLINLRSGNTGRNFNAINVLQIFLLCFFVFSLTPLIVSHMHMLVLPNLLFSTSILSYCCSEGVCCVSNLQPFSRQHYGKSQIGL